MRFRGGKVGLLIAILGLAAMGVFWFDRDGTSRVQADIQKVEKSDEAGFDYEYEAATFDVFMGEEGQKPKVKVRQGLRELEITVEGLAKNVGNTLEQPTPTVSVTPGPEVTVSPEATPGSTATPETTAEPTLEPTITPEVTPEPSPSPEASPSTSPVSWLGTWFGAQVQAQEIIEVVNPETEPAVEYTDTQFTLTPTLDKVELEFPVTSAQALPTLQVESKQLKALDDGGKIVFQTRTNRKAFTLGQASLTDAAGEEQSVAVRLAEGAPTAGQGHDVTFQVTTEDGTALKLPGTLKVELVSLFHDRMLPVRPLKRDFKAGEELQFEVDMAEITDEEMRSALADDALPGVRFGLIDTAGNTKQLSARVLERQGDTLWLAATTAAAGAEPGLFDLLIQRGESEAYISEEDFSWGVLAINPDMAVYPPGETARLDIGVLDVTGRQVCTADVVLTITDPAGNVSERSTADGSIVISDSCREARTTEPDYTTTYPVGPDGEYQLTLSSTTEAGTFVIEDSFKVDAQSPFYVRRRSNTRIFPLLDYDMDLEVQAKVSGKFEITEELAPQFGVVKTSGTLQEGPTVVWQEEFTAGETKTLSYTYDPPLISPALFLLGPVTIRKGGNAVFDEGRQWQVAIDTVDVLTSGTSYSVSNQWNDSNNTIEVIGGGGGGKSGAANSTPAGGGGGGGAYGKSVNINMPEGSSVTINIGAAGGETVNGGNTWICNSTSSCANYTDTNVVASAKGGNGTSTSTGGSGGDTSGVVSGTGSLEQTGGTGGNGGTTTSSRGGGGGGGSGGPNGNGGNGGTPGASALGGGGGGGNGGGTAGSDSTGTNGANGGNNSGGSGGGTGGSGIGGNGSNGGGGAGGAGTTAAGGAFAGGNGSQGTEWTGAGSGGGAGGGGGNTRTNGSGNHAGGAGSVAANTGAGGGGGGSCGDAGCFGGAGTAGADGVIVITYTPTGPTVADVMRHGNWFSGGTEQGFNWAN